MSKGFNIYLKSNESSLILEAIDMLQCDYADTGGHSEESELQSLISKIIKADNKANGRVSKAMLSTVEIAEYTAQTIDDVRLTLNEIRDYDFGTGSFEEFCDFVWDTCEFHLPSDAEDNYIKFDELELFAFLELYREGLEAEARWAKLYE